MNKEYVEANIGLFQFHFQNLAAELLLQTVSLEALKNRQQIKFSLAKQLAKHSDKQFSTFN